MSKVVSLAEAAALVRDGDTLALGGNLLHRIPAAFARALARAGRRRLELVKTAAAYDVDLLCAAGAVATVHAGYVGYETHGMAPAYRRAVESGAVTAAEHACTTVIAALRAAAFGVPFQPVAGLDGSDLPAARGWRRIADPYGRGGEVVVIPSIRPDWAVLHVQVADAQGNGRILGAPYEDPLMARAARRVILTAERLVPSADLAREPELTQVPGFAVAAVVHAPGGAWPGSCHGFYDVDAAALDEWLRAAREPARLAAHLEAAR
ncbi:MAG TPA: CoA transferase [Thermodesulfobacteriota bacterium]